MRFAKSARTPSTVPANRPANAILLFLSKLVLITTEMVTYSESSFENQSSQSRLGRFEKRTVPLRSVRLCECLITIHHVLRRGRSHAKAQSSQKRSEEIEISSLRDLRSLNRCRKVRRSRFLKTARPWPKLTIRKAPQKRCLRILPRLLPPPMRRRWPSRRSMRRRPAPFNRPGLSIRAFPWSLRTRSA